MIIFVIIQLCKETMEIVIWSKVTSVFKQFCKQGVGVCIMKSEQLLLQ